MKKLLLWILMLLVFKSISAQTTVNITVMDSYDYSTVVSGATVTLAGTSVITASDGLATFIIPSSPVDTYYSYTVKASGFIDYSNDWLYIAANSTNADNSTYIDRAYSISFVIVDKNKSAIPGAVIDINGIKDTTDAFGNAIFSKEFASSWNPYNYLITADGYADYASSVSISQADAVVDTIMLDLAFNIKLTLKDASDVAIEDASVTIGNVTNNTLADGSVIFNKRINGSYAYQISKSGYIDVAGSAVVEDKDTSVKVTMLAGHDLKLIVVNGDSGIVGLPNDTITIGSITKYTDANGVAVFGLDTGNVSFTVKKAGFFDNPVSTHVSGMNDSAVIYMTPFYNVYFTILDGYSYSPIQGVHVKLNGVDAISDEFGQVSFLNIPPSDSLYTYTLTSDSGYSAVSNKISLPVSSIYVDQFNIVNLNPTMNKPGITIALENGMMSYYSPATINLNGVDYDYNTGLGSVRIDIAPGVYKYMITPEDQTKAILKGFVEVGTGGDDFQVYDISDGYKVEIYAADIHSNPIVGASVIFAGDTVLTDDSGDAIFNRESAGDYSYSIKMDGYKDVPSTNLSIFTSDVLEIATMNMLGYQVTFHVSDGISAIENATIDFNSGSLYTDASGMATFDGLSAGSYPYSVSMDGYLIDQGNVDIVDTNLTKEIVLVINGINKYNQNTIRIYPNPVFDRMNIALGNAENKDVRISIFDLSGKLVKTASFEKVGPVIEMNVNELSSGSYFIKIQSNSSEHVLKLIKK